MMRKESSRALFIWLATAVGLIALLILPGLLAPQSRLIAHAQPAPREILVNAQCSEQHEHIRFGQESSHYYYFWAKRGLRYQASTKIFATNQDGLAVDTQLFLYRDNPLEHHGQHPLAQSDDLPIPLTPTPQSQPTATPPPQAYYQSAMYYTIPEDGYYWVQVENRIAGGEGSYCLQILLLAQNPFADWCEPNDSFAEACELQNNVTISANFAGYYLDNQGNPEQDKRDFYKLWATTPGVYQCQAIYRSNSWTDNNSHKIIFTFYNHDRLYLDAHKINNEEDATSPTNVVADVTVQAPGWLYILVEPVPLINNTEGDKYVYELACSGPLLPTPTPTTPVIAHPIDNYNPAPPPNPWQATVTPSGASLPDAGEAVAAVEETPAAPALAVGPVAFVALPQPAATPLSIAAGRAISFTVQIYHDKNDDQIKDPDEGIVNLPVYIYGGAAPLQMITGMGGGVFVGLETNQNMVRLVIPYLGVDQEIPAANIHDIRIRIAP